MSDAHTSLLTYIEQKISLSEEERKHVVSNFYPIHAKKHSSLIQIGERVDHLYFVLEGFIRCFYVDDQGNEVTAEIMGPQHFVTAFESFVEGKNSRITVECITDAKLLSISKAGYDSMNEVVAEWSVFCNSIYERYLFRNNKRVHALQNLSAKARYQQLMERQPELVLHTPIKYLASYLGIRPQSLSRIRKSVM